MKSITSATQFPQGEHLAVITFVTKGTRDFGGTYCSYFTFDNEEDFKKWIIERPGTQYKLITVIPKNVVVDVKIS